MKAWRRKSTQGRVVSQAVCPTGVNLTISDAFDPLLSAVWTWSGVDPDTWDLEISRNGGGFAAGDPPSVTGSERSVVFDLSPDPGDTFFVRIRGVIGGTPCAWEVSNFLIWPG